MVIEVIPRSVLTASKQANLAVEGWEKGTVGSGERMQKSLERMSEMLPKVNDRCRSSMERLTQVHREASRRLREDRSRTPGRQPRPVH